MTNHTIDTLEELKDFDPSLKKSLFSTPSASKFFKQEKVKVLILKFLILEDQELEDTYLRFIFIDNKVFQFFDEKNIVELKEDLDDFYIKIRSKIKYTQKLFMALIDEVDILEDSIYERKVSHFFMDAWFQFKKDISKIERSSSRSSELMKELNRSLAKDNLFDDLEKIQDLLSSFQSLARNAQIQVSKLDSLHHYYTSLKNEKINSNIYLLTIMSGIFLPLNIIVGFFGMNTENLFFKDNAQGTQYVLYLLAGSFVLMTIGIPLSKYFTKIIFSNILSRYDFYKRISRKWKGFTDVFNK